MKIIKSIWDFFVAWAEAIDDYRNSKYNNYY